MGNHENRVNRFLEDASNARFRSVISPKNFALDGWKVHPFLKPAKIDGIHYSHYFKNKGSDRPIGGDAHYKLKKLMFSYVVGHVQDHDSARICLQDGRTIRGLMAGTFYQHDENYLGHTQNYWRGINMLHEVKQGNYDLMEVSLRYLLDNYL